MRNIVKSLMLIVLALVLGVFSLKYLIKGSSAYFSDTVSVAQGGQTDTVHISLTNGQSQPVVPPQGVELQEGTSTGTDVAVTNNSGVSRLNLYLDADNLGDSTLFNAVDADIHLNNANGPLIYQGPLSQMGTLYISPYPLINSPLAPGSTSATYYFGVILPTSSVNENNSLGNQELSFQWNVTGVTEVMHLPTNQNP